MIWYSQEARSYMLLLVLTGASFWWFVRCWRDGSARNLTWWAAFSAAALMTHFFAGFLVGPEALLLLWRLRSRAAVIAFAVVAAAQAAMLPFALTDATASYGTGWIAAHPLVNRIATTVIQWGASNLDRRVTTPVGLGGGALVALAVVLLVVGGGDGRTRRGAALAGTLVALVLLLPLALALAGQDYFLSRNELPGFVPAVAVVAAACAAPRARVAGAALAAVLLTLFCLTAIDVQTHPYLQRANWRAVAQALGSAAAPRAIIAAGGSTADPLKVYLPGVSWVQPQRRRVAIGEVDIVGATKRGSLAGPVGPTISDGADAESVFTTPDRSQLGRPVPRSIAPRGARLLARFSVHNWVIARFVLKRPQVVDVLKLKAMAPRFFRHTPATMLIFVQTPTH
jgi:hypothetical protein